MFSFFQSVVLTVLLAFFLRFFVVTPFIVEGSSMEPNFHDQEYIIIDKVTYRLGGPKRGDVIVFHPPTDSNQNYIKRIIGLPGETVQITDGDVYVNNHKIDEPYLGENHATANLHQVEPITLRANQYFVLGDNRNHSSDSREWGPLDKSKIEGRTWFIALPVQKFHFIHTPTYQTSRALVTQNMIV